MTRRKQPGAKRWRFRLWWTVAAGLLPGLVLAQPDPRLFPVPAELEPNVDFWTKVYSVYDDDTVLLHDEMHLNVVYAALDFSALDDGRSAGRMQLLKQRKINETETKYKAVLADLAAGRVSKTHPNDQARVEQMFAAVPGGREKYAAARNRLRTQTCLRNRFAEGIERSGLYMPKIEAAFRSRGVPVEISRLAFVESLFQWEAKSSASAVGIWQFMAGTARYYLDMKLEYDERLDPLAATDAAARHLADNYKALGTWPLAITAYNHGAGGMKRAVRQLGTRDLGDIVRRYQSRTFGFASRNFYAEFLAAANVYAERERLFPTTTPLPELRFEEWRGEHYVPIRDLADGAGADLKTLREMNPALSSQVWDGHLYLPGGYALKVPAGRSAAFQAAYTALPEDRRSAHQVGHYYSVRAGDTLSTIATKFGASIAALQRANHLSSPHRIRIGQRLLIPPGPGSAPRLSTGASAPATVEVVADAPLFHSVRSGETLTSIAARYGTTVPELMARNRLASAHRLGVGQKLSISGTGSATRSHVVRRGETLTAIARRYGTTVSALQRANQLRGHVIHPRQVLVIP